MSHRTLMKAINPQPAKTPVTKPIRGREREMVKTNTAGYGFKLSPMQHVERFLVLGTDGSIYHASGEKLTIQALGAVNGAIAHGHSRAIVDLAVEISHEGRAPKNDPALMALAAVAMSAPDDLDRAYAYANLPKVARISTHLFHFIDYCREIRGKQGASGNGIKRAIQRWYDRFTPEQFAYQALKYQSRDGWSHRDVLRRFRPDFSNQENALAANDVAAFIVKGEHNDIVPILGAYQKLHREPSKKAALTAIRQFNFSREMLPSQLLTDPDVQYELLVRSGLTALIRNLGNNAKAGILGPLSEGEKWVMAAVTDEAKLIKDRIHPIHVLQALKVYGGGHSIKGDGTWKVNPRITKALEDAFYLSFKAVKPSGKRIVIGVDTSGSMQRGAVLGNDLFTPAEVAAVMAMTTVRTEPNAVVLGYDKMARELQINANSSLAEAQRTVKGPPEHTCISAPYQWARKNNLDVDGFMFITDNEVNAGDHPADTKKGYEKHIGHPVRTVMCATSLTNFTMADPKDPNALDMAGFDSAAPSIVSQFIGGQL